MFRIPLVEVDALLHCMQAGSAAHLPNVETGSKQDVLEDTHDNICLPAFSLPLDTGNKNNARQ